MPRLSRSNRKRRWKMERASVHGTRRKVRDKRPRSNKYSSGDTDIQPKPHTRKQLWVGGYQKNDGTKIAGYYRRNPQYRT